MTTTINGRSFSDQRTIAETADVFLDELVADDGGPSVYSVSGFVSDKNIADEWFFEDRSAAEALYGRLS